MITAFKKSNSRLLLTMILVSLMVTAVAVAVIYHITLIEKKGYLKQLAENEYQLLVSVYQETGDLAQVLEMMGEQHSRHPGLGETGEFLAAVIEGDSIRLLYYNGIRLNREPLSFSLSDSKAEASKFAASGKRGYLKGLDYRGMKVLAYGEYIQELEWGIVIKVNFSEITGPFWEASLVAMISALVLVLLGIFFFKRFSDPLFERIRESEEKYHMLFELIPSGITIANIKGEIIESNLESERLLGMPRDRHSKMRIDSADWKIIQPDHSPMPVSEFASTKALNENRVVANVEMGIVKKDGQVTWLNVSAAPFPVRDLGIIVVYTDITRRVEAEMKLQEHDREMEEMVRELKVLNNTKDKFFSIMAHDLKNPFGSLLGASEYLYKEINNQDIDKSRKLSKILYHSSKNAYDILANLLEWSRSQSGSMEYSPARINLFEIANKNVLLASAQAAEKEIDIELKVKQDFECEADPNMLNTIIRNLLTNAIKFTPEGGKVILDASRNKKEAVISVKDTGTGIPEGDLDKLFRIDVKFVNTGTNNEKGTGLGLILCREFIEYHGGKIWVESNPGEGSTFYFTLPDPINNG
jgi:PAS domain S-box-containing protein